MRTSNPPQGTNWVLVAISFAVLVSSLMADEYGQFNLDLFYALRQGAGRLFIDSNSWAIRLEQWSAEKWGDPAPSAADQGLTDDCFLAPGPGRFNLEQYTILLNAGTGISRDEVHDILRGSRNGYCISTAEGDARRTELWFSSYEPEKILAITYADEAVSSVSWR